MNYLRCVKLNRAAIQWQMRRLASVPTDSQITEDDDETIPPPRDESKFNKSRLLPQDRNRLHNNLPYNEPQSWIHLTEKYQRKMYALYGAEKSGVNPRICFPNFKDSQTEKLKTKIAEPKSLQQMMADVVAQRAAEKSAYQRREDDVAKKLEKLEQWKAELRAKIAKKEADILATKERKERLIEEVRRHFGFKVDPRDDRFKELLEQKEREDKKKQKESKRKAKEEKMMAKLLETSPPGAKEKPKDGPAVDKE